MRHALPLLAALALAACQPQAPDGSPAQPPADAPAPVPVPAAPAATAGLSDAFKGDLDGAGTEPFWGVLIREGEIRFSQPETRVAGPNKGGAMQGGKAVWETEAEGKSLKVTLSEQPGCSDGMSDLKYPLAAEVVFDGKTFKGCASKTAEKPKRQ